MSNSPSNQDLIRHSGSCHCGAVKFEFQAVSELPVLICNCSICRRTKFEHVIVPKENFTLIEGKASLTTYRFGTQTAVHTFCSTCGVKPFYSPRSHPDSYSVNLNCVDQQTVSGTIVEYFDGQNWEQARENLHLHSVTEIQSS